MFICAPNVEAESNTVDAVKTRVAEEYPALFNLYRELHAHPELSFQEENTSRRIAGEFRSAGYEVTEHVGKFGVVGLLRNGPGPTVLVRTDMDALPVKEQTGLPFASAVTAKDPQGIEVPVMHACGHDMNMTCVVGAARLLAHLTNHWKGTVMVIGQPAEERGGGARAMLGDGLFERFPSPDFCLALHDDAGLPAGTIGYIPGFALANVDSVDVLIHGVGGHGAYPQKTKDPIVLAAQIILDLQTIVSREIAAGEPAVVTVGSIHGGSKHNIIPDEVRLQLTVRSYSDGTRKQLLEAIRRIARGQAIAAGLPENLLPEVKPNEDYTAATYNDPALAERLANVFKTQFGKDKVIRGKPQMGGEDFGEYGRTRAKIPIFMFQVGAVRPEVLAESERTGKTLPSLHSSLWAPETDVTIHTGVTAMTIGALELLGKK